MVYFAYILVISHGGSLDLWSVGLHALLPCVQGRRASLHIQPHRSGILRCTKDSRTAIGPHFVAAPPLRQHGRGEQRDDGSVYEQESHPPGPIAGVSFAARSLLRPSGQAVLLQQSPSRPTCGGNWVSHQRPAHRWNAWWHHLGPAQQKFHAQGSSLTSSYFEYLFHRLPT